MTYITEPIKYGSVEYSIIAMGEIAPFQLVTVGAQVSGQVKKLHIIRGQKVSKGELIAEIDSTTQLNELNSQRALLKNYQAQLAARKIALDVARKKYDREFALKRQDATSRESFEAAQSALARATADAAEMQSLITRTEISVKTADANLGYTKITAPINGTVLSVSVEEGQTINASQITPAIIQLADLGIMSLNIFISEADVTKVKPGMDVSFKILSDPVQKYTTKLLSIDPTNTISTADVTNKSSLTKQENAVYYYGRALVNNIDGKLRTKMTAECQIIIASKANVLIVPSTGIIQQDLRYTTKVLTKNGIIEEREVTVGLSDSLNTEIKSGLQLGESIIISSISGSEIDENIEKFR